MWRYVLCSTIIIFISILYHYKTNRPASIIDYPEDRYDFVIVGAGTAGCVLASRLSEVPNTSVLLIEAGEYFNWYSIVPLTAPMMQKTPVDWSYKTETQFYSSRALKNSQQLWPRGKGLGGSGQMNYMVHSFGSPEDYETWPSGWNYKDLRPYFGKVSKIMGFSGPSPEPELAKIFTGIDVTKLDGNVTIDKSSSNIKRGTRWSTYHAYLQDAWNRNNLHIITNTLATKILFEDDETTVEGIKVKFKDGTLGRIGVEKSLILCAGAVNTPHLMLVSGLGPYEDLQKSRVHVVKNVSQVGKNLYDHLNLPIYVNLKSEISITLQKIDSILELIKYVFNGGGLFATNGIMGTAKRKNSGIVMSGFASADEELLKDIVNFETDTFRNFFPSHSDASHEGFILMVSCLQPKSRGNVTLKSYTIFDPPLIEPAYLENSWDIDCTQEGVNLALDILDLDDLKSLGAKVHTPKIDGCRHFPQDYRDPDYSECIIRSGGLAGHHPGGTCAMGSDENSVLDNKLRVNGINKLRIVDASILPTPISGTPNSVIIAIAERAADVILNIPLKT